MITSSPSHVQTKAVVGFVFYFADMIDQCDQADVADHRNSSRAAISRTLAVSRS